MRHILFLIILFGIVCINPKILNTYRPKLLIIKTNLSPACFLKLYQKKEKQFNNEHDYKLKFMFFQMPPMSGGYFWDFDAAEHEVAENRIFEPPRL
jgi:hypothetical protein